MKQRPNVAVRRETGSVVRDVLPPITTKTVMTINDVTTTSAGDGRVTPRQCHPITNSGMDC